MLGLIPTTFHFTATHPSISWRSPLKWSGSHHPQKEKTEYWVCQTFHPLAIPRNSGDKEQPWENPENTDLLLVMTAMLSLWFYKVWITCKKSDTLKVWKHRPQNTLRDMVKWSLRINNQQVYCLGKLWLPQESQGGWCLSDLCGGPVLYKQDGNQQNWGDLSIIYYTTEYNTSAYNIRKYSCWWLTTPPCELSSTLAWLHHVGRTSLPSP